MADRGLVLRRLSDIERIDPDIAVRIIRQRHLNGLTRFRMAALGWR